MESASTPMARSFWVFVFGVLFVLGVLLLSRIIFATFIVKEAWLAQVEVGVTKYSILYKKCEHKQMRDRPADKDRAAYDEAESAVSAAINRRLNELQIFGYAMLSIWVTLFVTFWLLYVWREKRPKTR